MSGKVLHHRTPEFEKILREAWSGLQQVFATAQPVQIIAGSGSAAMEAAVVNLLSAGDEALVVVSGKFGERWAEMAERYGVRVTRWSIPWGKKLDLSEFERQLRLIPNCKAVFSQVCETSTATIHPVKEMSEIVRKNSQALFAVDAISAIGCAMLEMDKWGIDCVVAGSQKAFMIPAGLSFIAFSERAWEAQAKSNLPKFYFDMALEKKANTQRFETHFSTPVPLVTGLRQVLAQMQKVGLDKVRLRSEALAIATREGGELLGLKVFSETPSPSVTALITPTDSGSLREILELDHGITVMGGQDQQKGKILRIGHMGDIQDEDLLAFFEALSEILEKKDIFPQIKAKILPQLQAAPVLFPR